MTTYIFAQLLWNIVLLCLGRHPLQNPHQIKPEIGKLPKHIVDQIPLVLYIPPPPDAIDASTSSPTKPASTPAHGYPPTRKPSSQKKKPRWRFAFFRRKRRSVRSDGEKGKEATSDGRERERDPEKMTWEERWEPGEYPFVRLEGNRAVCAICLLDFEPPKRIDGAGEDPDDKVGETDGHGDAVGDDASEKVGLEDVGAGDDDDDGVQGDESVHEVQVGEVTEEEREQLRLDDAGEGAVPLRLLECGHVFHVCVCAFPYERYSCPPGFTANLRRPVANGRIGALSGLPETRAGVIKREDETQSERFRTLKPM